MILQRLSVVLLIAGVLLAGLTVSSQSPAHAANLGFPTGKGWAHPVPNETFEDWGFDNCTTPYVSDKYGNYAHLGADSQGSNPWGTPVRSIASGTVRNVVHWSTAYGYAVTIEHSSTSGRFLAVYGHVTSAVKIGQQVGKGQTVGRLFDLGGNTHLHLGVKPLGGGDNGSGWYPKGMRLCGSQTNPGLVNPIPWLAARAPGTASAPPSPAPNGTGDRLDRGEGLSKGHSLWSGNGYYRLAMQSDGNLVLYGRSGALKAWNTVGTGSHLILHSNGELALYSTSGKLWSSNTGGTGADRLVVQNDGNLVLYAGSRAVWASSTQQAPNQPFGSLDNVASQSRLTVYVRGWAMDADGPTSPVKVHVYTGSTFIGELVADRDRPDVRSAYPAFGAKHGYEGTLTVPSGGAQSICGYAINRDRGSNQKIGCKTVEVVTTGPPAAPIVSPTAYVGDGSAFVTWAPPSSDGGAPVTGYQVRSNPDAQTCAAGAGEGHCIVSGLTNGSEYTFQVRASNAVGWSAWSVPTSPVVPKNSRKCWDSDSSRDNRVDAVDLSTLLTDWNTTNSRSDPSRDGFVDIVDLSILLSNWGPCPYSRVEPTSNVAALGAVTDPAAFTTQAAGLSTQADAATSPVGSLTVLKGLGGSSEVVGRAADGTLFGHASADVPQNGQPVVWNGPDDVPTVIDVPGVEDAVITDVNAEGVVVGTGLRPGGGSDHLAWYRDRDGVVGLLDADGAVGAVALSINDVGQISGFVETGTVRPVVWDSTTAAPRYMEVDASGGGTVTSIGVDGATAGSMVQDRLAVWSPTGSLTTVAADGEAIDINVDGAVLYGSASEVGSAPRLRSSAGVQTTLAGLASAGGEPPIATALTDEGSVAGSSGGVPVVWPRYTTGPRPLSLPGGAEGRALGVAESGHAFGWTRDDGGQPQAALWTDLTLGVAPPPPPPPPPAPPPPPTPTPEPKSPTVKVKTPKQAKIKANVNPDLSGKKSWKIQFLKKKKGTFVKVKTVRTKGPRELVTVDVPRGRYKVRVPAQRGYGAVTSKVVRVRR